MLWYYRAYYQSKLGRNAQELLEQAESLAPDCCFPNKLEDIPVLEFAIEQGCKRKVPYYLGCLYYDKLQWEKAARLWELGAENDSEFPTVHRNLALAYYNKCGEPQRALEELERAFALDTSDARVFLELDQLHKKLGWSFEKRLEEHLTLPELLESRDDLYIEHITLLNMTGRHEEAYERIMGHRFHPWEGGEGKVTTQYVLALLSMAKKGLMAGEYIRAEELLRGALVYPENLGEGKLEETRSDGRKVLWLTVAAGAIGGVIVLIARPFVLMYAGSGNFTQTALEYLGVMLLINSYYVMGAAVNTTLIAGVFRAGGDSRFGLICDAIVMWVYAVPVGFLCAFVLKLPVLWVYFILCLDEFVKWPAVIHRYRSGKWLKNITRDNLFES